MTLKTRVEYTRMFQPLLTGSNFAYIECFYVIGKFIRQKVFRVTDGEFRACRAYSAITQRINLACECEFTPLRGDFQRK